MFMFGKKKEARGKSVQPTPKVAQATSSTTRTYDGSNRDVVELPGEYGAYTIDMRIKAAAAVEGPTEFTQTTPPMPMAIGNSVLIFQLPAAKWRLPKTKLACPLRIGSRRMG